LPLEYGEILWLDLVAWVQGLLEARCIDYVPRG
jgi:hypothetical protein